MLLILLLSDFRLPILAGFWSLVMDITHITCFLSYYVILLVLLLWVELLLVCPLSGPINSGFCASWLVGDWFF
jgi:hypothetical protein